ncbi:hypothetical protein OG592_21920 [Streptomyces avidinii]|uniref:hypothetical protein n=1 Tax=Streptomyces avidinii TaxID=1895 RepID=UPI00386AA660|nr:hypothetical protein OG592_21920 [Streptomyces avidinii]
MKSLRPLALASVASLVLLATSVTATAAALDSRDDPPKPAPPTAPGDAVPLSAHTHHSGPVVNIPAGGFSYASVNCPSGSVPTGGGGQTSSGLTLLTDSFPAGNGWTIGVKNTDTATRSAWAHVVCTVP